MGNYVSTTGTTTDIIINQESYHIDRKQYEEDLKRRQKEHLDSIQRQNDANWRPCLHDSCPECLGTGLRRDGSFCVHNISCPCPKCTPQC